MKILNLEKLDQYLTVEKCLRCGQDLTKTEIKYKNFPELECPRCNLIIQLTSVKNRLKTACLGFSLLAGFLGFIFGTMV